MHDRPDPLIAPRPDADDPFASLPADLAALARDFDAGMRKNMRWLAGVMQVSGFSLAGYLAWYVQRQGRLGSPRDEEWIPALIVLAVGTAGVWLWRRAEHAPLVRGLVARFPEVRHVRLVVAYPDRRYGRRTSLVFEPAHPWPNVIPVGNMNADDPKALHLLAEARRLCPQAE